MALKPGLIYTDNPGAAPATFVLPAGLDLVLQSVVARWDGAAAAGTFKPCLSAYSQDGRLMGRFFPPSDLAVGDTGVVTYAPFLRAEAPSPAAGAVISYARVSVTNMAIVAGGTVVDFAAIDSTFDQSGFVALSGGGDAQITAAGIYGFHLLTAGEVLQANVNTQLEVHVADDSGLSGLWSSRPTGALEGFATFALRIDDAASVSVLAPAQEILVAYVALSVGLTFPITITVTLFYTEDNVGSAQTPDVFMTIVRLGAGDE